VTSPEPETLGVKEFLVQWQNIIATGISILCFVVVLIFFRGQVSRVIYHREAVLSSLEWIQSYVTYHDGFSAAIFVLLYVVANSLFIPQFALGLAGGLIFGLPMGFLLVAVGILGSAQSYYWLAKWMGRPFLERFGWVELQLFRNYLSGLDMKTILLLRLNPMIPYHPLNASCGLYSVPVVQYLLGTMLGLSSRVFVYVFLGASLTEHNAMFFVAVITWVVVAIGHFSFGFWQIRNLVSSNPR